MRFTPTRPRLAATAFLLLAALALILGILVPPDRSEASAAPVSTAPARLLVSEFSDDVSTLWLVDADDPAERELFAQVAHAPGWDVAGAVGPESRRLAYLVLPPGAREARSQALLMLIDHDGQEHELASGLDLRGGLAWSADGTALYVRRSATASDGRQSFVLLEIDSDDGQARALLRRADVFGIYPVGRPENGAAYAVLIGADGSELIAVGAGGDGSDVVLLLSEGVTRDWRLSPDGTQLAFTEQSGLELRVRLTLLDAEESDTEEKARAARSVAAISAALETADSDGNGGTASPIWHPDGSLSVGSFGAPEGSPTLRVQADGSTSGVGTSAQGFALPLAWSPEGTHLAVRAFKGSGPGATSAESAAVIGPDGEALTIEGQFIRVLGWWHDAG